MEESRGSQIVSAEECFVIIKHDLNLTNTIDYTFNSYSIKKCSSDLVGFMGAYYKLEIQIIEKHKDVLRDLCYFVKSIPLDNKVYRDECERKGFFPKESSIYRNILPHIQRYASGPLYPQTYLTRNDLIVMEDFTLPEKRLKQMEDNEVYSLKHYQLFLQHLAELHAASLAWEIKESINIGEQFKNVLYELQLTTTNEWYLTGIKSIIYLAQQHPKYQYPEAVDFINHNLYNILLKMEDATKPSPTLRNVLCHRDSWDRNIFWEYNQDNEPIACRIVDFQLTRYSPPAIDVLYFLYNNFETPQKRSKHLKDLLLYYHDALKAALKSKDLSESLITKSDFDKDCQLALFPILTLRGICEPLMQLPKGWSQSMRETEPEKFDYYMNAERSGMFCRVAQIDSSYMEKIFLPIQEILEYFNLEPK